MQDQAPQIRGDVLDRMLPVTAHHQHDDVLLSCEGLQHNSQRWQAGKELRSTEIARCAANRVHELTQHMELRHAADTRELEWRRMLLGKGYGNCTNEKGGTCEASAGPRQERASSPNNVPTCPMP